MITQPTRKERERLRHRQEVLTAALDLFSRRGFDKTTMADIARQAEFAVGTLYKLFKDKYALYRALIVDTLERCAQALTLALKTPGSELQKIERYMETKAALFSQHIPTARLYFAQTTGAGFISTAGLDEEARAVYEKVLGLLESVVRSGIRKKLILDLDPRMIVIGLEGLSNAFLLELTERPADFTVEKTATLMKRLLFEQVGLPSSQGREPRDA